MAVTTYGSKTGDKALDHLPHYNFEVPDDLDSHCKAMVCYLKYADVRLLELRENTRQLVTHLSEMHYVVKELIKAAEDGDNDIC